MQLRKSRRRANSRLPRLRLGLGLAVLVLDVGVVDPGLEAVRRRSCGVNGSRPEQLANAFCLGDQLALNPTLRKDETARPSLWRISSGTKPAGEDYAKTAAR
jgi:hypothetical protein